MTPINQLVDLLMRPFAGLPPEAGLAAFSLLTALAVLLVFKATSRPERVARARERALAPVLELWLYRHDPWTGLRSIGRMLLDNMRYLGSLLLPLVCSLPLMLLLLSQGHDWFAARAPNPGERFLLVARLDENADPGTYRDLSLASGSGAARPPRVASPAWREVAWRLTPADLDRRLVLRLGTVEIAKQAVLKPGLARRSQVRARNGFERLLYPGEQRLPPHQPVRRLELRFPPAEYNLLGWRTSWLWGILVLSLLAGLLLKKPLRVEF